MSFSLSELAARIGAREVGSKHAERVVEGVAPLDTAGPGQCAFYANPRYKKDLLATRAGFVLVSEDDAKLVPAHALALIAAQPYVAFAKASSAFHPAPKAIAGIAPGALVHPEAKVDPSAQIQPGAIVGPNAVIGARTILRSGAVVLAFAQVGKDCLLHAGAVVRERCIVGDRVILQPNSVVGSDGFGFAFDIEGDADHSGPMHRKVPQAGIARVEDDVEVGACTCIDRATLGETVIGRGTKIDNLVQVGHNVQVGPMSLLVAQVGISGSTTLGAGVVLAGQVGVIGHLHIGDGARIGAQSGVASDVPEGATLSGTPAIDHREWLRLSASLPKLAGLVREVKQLSKKVAELEAALARAGDSR